MDDDGLRMDDGHFEMDDNNLESARHRNVCSINTSVEEQFKVFTCLCNTTLHIALHNVLYLSVMVQALY